MDNVLKKFYSAGETDYFTDPNKNIYNSFFSANVDKNRNINMSNSKSDIDFKKPILNKDEDIFNKIPIVDEVFTTKFNPNKLHSIENPIYEYNNYDRININKGDSMKIQIMEERIKQLERKNIEEREIILERLNLKKKEEVEYAEAEYNNLREDDNKRNHKKLDEISEILISFKDDLIKRVKEDNISNREIIYNLNKDLKNFKTDVKNILETINNKHKIQLENLKSLIESSNNPRMKELAGKLLNNRNIY